MSELHFSKAIGIKSVNAQTYLPFIEIRFKLNVVYAKRFLSGFRLLTTEPQKLQNRNTEPEQRLTFHRLKIEVNTVKFETYS